MLYLPFLFSIAGTRKPVPRWKSCPSVIGHAITWTNSAVFRTTLSTKSFHLFPWKTFLNWVLFRDDADKSAYHRRSWFSISFHTATISQNESVSSTTSIGSCFSIMGRISSGVTSHGACKAALSMKRSTAFSRGCTMPSCVMPRCLIFSSISGGNPISHCLLVFSLVHRWRLLKWIYTMVPFSKFHLLLLQLLTSST